MRLKSYLLITGITAAALFGATPAFADEPAPESGNAAPSPDEEAPAPSPSPDEEAPTPSPSTSPEEEECWALLEEAEASGSWRVSPDSPEGSGMSCEELVAEWEAELEDRGIDPWAPATPAEPRPDEPNYTG